MFKAASRLITISSKSAIYRCFSTESVSKNSFYIWLSNVNPGIRVDDYKNKLSLKTTPWKHEFFEGMAERRGDCRVAQRLVQRRRIAVERDDAAVRAVQDRARIAARAERALASIARSDANKRALDASARPGFAPPG